MITAGGGVNENAILREILLTGPVARNEIADRLGINQGTVSRIARSLIDARLVREHEQKPGEGPIRPGRRLQPLTVDPRGGQVLGIAVLPTIQIVALSDLGRNVVASAEFSFDPIEDAEEAIRRVGLECRRLIGQHVPDRSRLFGGLLLITADLEPATGNVRQSVYLGWDGFPLRARMSQQVNLPIEVGVATLAVGRAEALFGAARGRRNPLVLLCGAGIGAAALVNGRIAGDTSFPTGGLGRMPVTAEDGEVAVLDEVAGGVGIVRSLHGDAAADRPLWRVELFLRDAIERDRDGDPQVGARMARAGRELGRQVAQHTHFVRPDVIVMAGGLATAPSYLTSFRQALGENRQSPMEVVVSRVTDAEGGRWACCSLAVYEFLVERPAGLTR